MMDRGTMDRQASEDRQQLFTKKKKINLENRFLFFKM